VNEPSGIPAVEEVNALAWFAVPLLLATLVIGEWYVQVIAYEVSIRNRPLVLRVC
jgi:hypothetical protein